MAQVYEFINHKHIYYVGTDKIEDYIEMLKWLNQNIPEYGIINGTIVQHRSRFHTETVISFNTLEDAAAFKLRWL